jgi:protein-tyrosine phosphatase
MLCAFATSGPDNLDIKNSVSLITMKFSILTLLAALLLSSCATTLPASFYNKELKENTFVENNGKKYILHTTAPVKVQIENSGGQVAESVLKPDTVFTDTSKTDRPVFKILQPDTLLISNRHLYFKGVPNFRDIGGLPTQEGKKVRWGMIFRSDNLSRLKTKEFDKFKALHIATVYDLRIPAEIKPKQDHLPQGVQYVAQPLVNDKGDLLAGMKSRVLKGEISEMQSRDFMVDFYKEAITENIPTLQKLVHEIMASPSPVLYHCSAGKDRTGILTAMLLSILKVDRETIIDEYMLSNYYRKDQVQSMLKKVKAARVIKPKLNAKVIENFMMVDREYINAVFETIDKEYGGMDSFVKNQLQIDDVMRAAFITRMTF